MIQPMGYWTLDLITRAVANRIHCAHLHLLNTGLCRSGVFHYRVCHDPKVPEPASVISVLAHRGIFSTDSGCVMVFHTHVLSYIALVNGVSSVVLLHEPASPCHFGCFRSRKLFFGVAIYIPLSLLFALNGLF